MKQLQMKEIKIKNVKMKKTLKKNIKRAYLIIWLPVRKLGKFAIIYPKFVWFPFYTIKKECFETSCVVTV